MNDRKYNFTLSLAIVDILPCILFGAAMIVLDAWFRNPLYVLAVITCTLAGFGKVIWKLIISLKGKDIAFFNEQFKIAMPIGFAMLIISMVTMNRKGVATIEILEFIVKSPSKWFVLGGIIGSALLVVWRFALDMNELKNNWIAQITNILAQTFFLVGALALVYTGDYYHYVNTYTNEELASMYDVQVAEEKEIMVFTPTKYEGFSPTVGMVFYPGGKVEAKAYIPLMEAIADKGMVVILVEMPDNLAILDYKAANRIEFGNLFPDVEKWYICGHSLGGASASMYLAGGKTEAMYEGLVLLGAYSTKDLSKTDLRVITIIGSEDHVMNKEKYEHCKDNLPVNSDEFIIEGGCHSYFGDYGMQAGDGTPVISAKEQWDATAEQIWNFVTE